MKENMIMYYNVPIGTLIIKANDIGISELMVCDEKHDDYIPEYKIFKLVQKELDNYFSGELKEFTVPLSFNGTTFQKRVWNYLKTIPYGMTCSYKEVAIAVGNPAACRAVGMACNRNPIMILIPCHRVVGSHGELTGFACGIDIKSNLLKLEKIKFD